MKTQKTFTQIIVFVITIIQLGNYAFAQNTFPNTPSGSGFVGIGTLSPAVDLHVFGDVKFRDPFSTEEISFARPGGQNGFNLTSVTGSSAHFKFDGASLRLVTSMGGFPLNTAGIAIETQNGWVGIGTTTPQCKLQLNENNSINYGSYFNSNSNGPSLFVERNGSGGSNPSGYLSGGYGSVFLNSHYTGGAGGTMRSGYFENSDPGGNVSIGVSSLATSAGTAISSIAFDAVANNAFNSTGFFSEATSYNNSYGTFSIGQNGAVSDYGVYGLGIGQGCPDVFGVYGEARAGKNNYGIYGTAGPENASCEGTSVWSGYFTGNVIAGAYFRFSDMKFKENVKSLDNAIAILNKLSPKTYTFKQSDEFLGLTMPKGEQFGFIAQELEQVLPNLVKKTHNPEIKDKDHKIVSKAFDFKSVDYTLLIPILVQGIKEQQAQIEELKTQIKNNSNPRIQNNDNSTNDMEDAILYQNSPNPFTESTTIKYHLANTGDAAAIMIFDMNGKLLKSYELNTQNLDGDVQISSGTFIPGMYYYSLVVKGKEVNTLKMILSK